jgi:Tir chaperone protein (CesT) family
MTDHQRETLALMRALGAGLGVALEPDASGACGLRVDDRLDLTLACEERRAALLVTADVGRLPLDPPEAVLRRLLAANLPADGSDATWSLVDETIVLWRRFPLAALDADALATELAGFVSLAFAEQASLAAAPGQALPAMPMLGMVAA